MNQYILYSNECYKSSHESVLMNVKTISHYDWEAYLQKLKQSKQKDLLFSLKCWNSTNIYKGFLFDGFDEIRQFYFFSLYCAVEHQLKTVKGPNLPKMTALRNMTSEFMRANMDDFLPFLSHPDTGEILTEDQFQEYCDQVAQTPAWGGQVEVSYSLFSSSLSHYSNSSK